jgi:hypothetical protein
MFRGKRRRQARNQRESRRQAYELYMTKGFHQILNYYVGSEVLTAVVMKSSTFWSITLCSPLKANRCFGGTGSACYLLSGWYPDWLIVRPWRRRRHVLPKRRLTFNRLHCVISQKTEFFITTDVRTSNPVWISRRALKLTDLCWVVVGLRPPPGAAFLRGDSLTRLCLRGDCCCCVGVVLPASDARLPPQLESSDVPPPTSAVAAGVTVPLPSRVPSSGVCAGVVVLWSVPQSSARNPSCMAGLRTIPGVITSLSALSRCTFLVLGCKAQQGIMLFIRVFLSCEIWGFCESEYEDYCILGCGDMWFGRQVSIHQTTWRHIQEDNSLVPLLLILHQPHSGDPTRNFSYHQQSSEK